jgi:hypothetical protein
MRQEKNRSDINLEFDLAKRGDIVRCAHKKRIEKANVFEIVSRWGEDL